MKHFIFFTFFLSFGNLLFAQSNDAVKITEARIALEKYKDCKNALAALQEVSQAGQNNSLFHLYAGKTYDCLNNFDKAIYYYELYLKTYPNASDIVQRTAELRYEKRKKENKFNLAGQWYADGEPGKIRNIQQYGNSIKLYDPQESGNKGIKFEGTLQPSGVFKGGHYYYFTKITELKEGESCKACTFIEKEYYDDDYEFYEKTDDDILYVSEDGNKITIKVSVAYLDYTVKYIKAEDKQKCVCQIKWRNETWIYIRIQ